MKNGALICLGIAAGLALHTSAQAGYVLFDNFNTYTPNTSLIGQGPVGNLWNQTVGSPTGMIVTPYQGGMAVFGGPSSPSAAYRALGPAGLTIANSSTTATVFWQFNLGTVSNNNWNFVLTDVNPTDTAGTSEAQFNFDSTAGNFRARNAGAFKNLSLDGTAAGNVLIVTGVTYNAWMKINNSADNYQVFLQSDGVAGLSSPVQVLANDGTGGTFGFRNGTAANDLINLNFGPGSGQTSQTVFDNVYIDPAGFNLINPVPEPSTWALLSAGGVAALLWHRRKRA
jgi:hypothetical protein